MTDLDQHSSPLAKIALFRSLFRGRDDVYPRRFESRKTGKSGYAPACANEWVRGVCEKPKIRCADCPQRRFLPVTDDVVRWHLSGRDDQGQPFIAGVYPMLQDESCFFLAIDFDKERWQQDVNAFIDSCRTRNLPAAVERSRSGRGGHVWFFFEEAIPATLARKLASFLLTETMERRPEVGLDSYDRLFPNQDTLPQGGFGNLIALPLQKQARERGNTVFLDECLEPHADQWSFLARIGRLGRARVERIVADADRQGGVIGVRVPSLDEDDSEPWTLPPSRAPKIAVQGECPERLEVILANEIYVSSDGLTPALRNRIVGWPPSRIRSSTAHRRCVSPPTTSPGSSPAPSSILITLVFLAVACRTCVPCSVTLVSASSLATNGAPANHSTSCFAVN